MKLKTIFTFNNTGGANTAPHTQPPATVILVRRKESSMRLPLTFSHAVRIFSIAAILLYPALADKVAAQSTLRGKVLDPNYAAIAGAEITAVSTGRPTSSTHTDRNGEFSLPLEPGEYALHVAADGFAHTTQTLKWESTNFQSVEIVLQLAGYSATVMVNDMSGYEPLAVTSATKTLTLLGDLPQSVTVVPHEVMIDQGMQILADFLRYVPGITAIQCEINRDQLVIRCNSSTTDF